MAHLWVRDSRADERWAIAPLESAAFTLVADPPYVVPRVPEDDEIGLMKAMPEYGAGDGKAQWVVLVGSPTRVRVNGLAVGGGIRALADRDEIRGPGLGRYFFSTEQLASVEALPAGPIDGVTAVGGRDYEDISAVFQSIQLGHEGGQHPIVDVHVR